MKKCDIRVAVHNHGPGDKFFPLPETAYKRIKGLDRRIGLCIDIGRTVRTGGDLN
jgi:inosose dehydratase